MFEFIPFPQGLGLGKRLYQGFFKLFAQGGGQNEIVWGKYVSVKLGGMFLWEISILDLLLDAILVESGTVFTQI